MDSATPPRLVKFPAAKQRRLDRLLEKNSEGTITPKEKLKLEQLVAEAEKLMVANARRLAEFARKQKRRPPSDAVPVTIWVQPNSAKS